MTLEQMLADLYAEFSDSPTPPPTVARQFTAYLNKAHRVILREPGMGRLRSTLNPLTFASEADRAIYGFPASILRVSAVTERDTDRKLTVLSLESFRTRDPGLNASGTPWGFVPLGFRPIQEPPASTGLWVASSSASDTTQTVTVNGVRSGGLPTGDVSANLNGTTRVAIGSLTDYVDVTSIVLQASGVGIISIFDASSGGNTLAQIPIGKTEPRYFCVQLVETPSSAVTYYVDGDLPIVELNGPHDVPMLPEEFHDLLPAYARMRHYEYKGDGLRFNAAKAEYEKGLGRLKYFINSQPAETWIMGQSAGARFSREGSWYPATW